MCLDNCREPLSGGIRTIPLPACGEQLQITQSLDDFGYGLKSSQDARVSLRRIAPITGNNEIGEMG